MNELKTELTKYDVLTPISISFLGAKDANGEHISGIVKGGVVQLDPKHSATESWLRNKAIKAHGEESTTASSGQAGKR
jgi:hypothetical protein